MRKRSTATLLRKLGLKHTSGREALLKVLRDTGKPMTHKEICSKLEPRQYDPVSVYRSLESFIDSGIVHRIEGDNRTWYFALCTCEGSAHCHPHFFCRSCGKCECLKELGMPDLPSLKEEYIIEEKRFYLKGLCELCASAANR